MRDPAGRDWATAGLLVAALLAIAAWLPFLDRPLTSDESGFLLLARQWHPGSSLYGDYWVDRPPLLLWLFSLADHLGHTRATTLGVISPGVKVVGAAASGAAVALTGVLTSLIAPHASRSRHLAVALAVALLSSPLLGMPETDGELLALPFVLLGMVCSVLALRRPYEHPTVVVAAAAGASAMAAALVKQNVVDVFVFAGVAVVVLRGRVERPGARVAGFAVGALAVLGTALAGAWIRGTSATGLWDAIVVFRLEASAAIGSSASPATTERLTRLVEAFVASGAAAVLVLAAGAVLAHLLGSRRTERAEGTHPTALFAYPVAALVGWELFGVMVGGSYWMHYLVGLVPGLVALVAIAADIAVGRTSQRVLRLVVAYTAAATVAVWAHHATATVTVSPDDQVMGYLREHARATDGVVVGFGHPDIVAGSGLASPYEQLWSLPVRVRDPQVVELRHVMAGPAAPRWVVAAGTSLDTWGLDAAGATDAQHYLQEHYVDRVEYGDWHVWQRREGGTR
ncbi:hypothetical protein ASC64_07250 [Nocardioides sp. Root122]|nr:hypothetical protein ASC64_07250 [Nocardioides sp. Root122]